MAILNLTGSVVFSEVILVGGSNMGRVIALRPDTVRIDIRKDPLPLDEYELHGQCVIPTSAMHGVFETYQEMGTTRAGTRRFCKTGEYCR